MKTLLILRHAKSSWKDVAVGDHDRPLNKRGKRDAPRVGQLLRDLEVPPQLIISSTAKRARKTASLVAKECGYHGIIELHGTLYLAPPGAYLETLRRVDDAVEHVLVVGHNPGLEQLLALLTGQHAHLPTAALVQLELDVAQWRDITTQTRAALVGLWRLDSPE
jgi:phosphohistidine phosphatase